MEDCTRRAFLSSAAAVLAGLPLRIHARRPAPAPLRIAVVRRSASGSAAKGLALGVDEAQRSAQLFGLELRTTTHDLGDAAPMPATLATAFGTDHAAVIIADLETPDAVLAVADAGRGAVVLNVSCASDALRAERCRRALFHVAPSDAMCRDAIARVSQGGDGSHVAAWHPTLERFGGAQLNDRFHARYAAPMDGPAWAGWFAAKVAAESALRARAATADALRDYLERPTASFDGHKGVPLSFRPWDHQLRQPLYLEEALPIDGASGKGPRRVMAVPDDGVPDHLDQIGTSAAQSRCRW